jgi:cytochrome P450
VEGQPQRAGTVEPEIDLLSDQFSGPSFWDAARELGRRGPLVWIEGRGGYWVTTTYEALKQVSQDHEHFCSGEGVTIQRPGVEQQPYVMPAEIDPPRQRLYRGNVNPHLSPKALQGLDDGIRAVADELIDAFVDRGSCDIATEFALVFPGTVFFRHLIEVDPAMLRVLEPLARRLSFGDPAAKADAARQQRQWAATVLEATTVDDPRANPLIAAVKRLADSDEAFADHELQSGVQILAQGGIGTSAMLIASIAILLCEHPDVQRRVRDDLGLVPALVEESLRVEPPVIFQFRTATCDIEIAGQAIRAGDKVGLFYGAANRDPAVFERPDEFDIDRVATPHLAFGLGIHRCIGSNLARKQVRIAIEQLLGRVPTFRLAEGAAPTYLTSFQRGPVSVPLDFSSSRR